MEKSSEESSVPPVGRNGRAQKGLRRKRGSAAGYWYSVYHAVLGADRIDRGGAPDLTEKKVLAWADAYHDRTSDWPSFDSGPIPEAPGETWFTVAEALALGLRGLETGGSLPRLFLEHRGRDHLLRHKLSVNDILAWADAWCARTGDWPKQDSGAIPGTGGFTWSDVDGKLRRGRCRLPGVSTLADFLAEYRGVRNLGNLPDLSLDQILAWALEHHSRTGRWPGWASGPIPGTGGETSHTVGRAFLDGKRGLEKGSSINPLFGAVVGASGETSSAAQNALVRGDSGHPGNSTRAQFLGERRKRRNRSDVPELSIPEILSWADAHRARTGKWPDVKSGAIANAPGETWSGINHALYGGARGLSGNSSLVRILVEHRGVRNRLQPPDLTIPQILHWAQAYFARNARWPSRTSGKIPEAPGETWYSVQHALEKGLRGLPVHSSVTQLLNEEFGAPSRGRPRRSSP
jgi:hypothetical protein